MRKAILVLLLMSVCVPARTLAFQSQGIGIIFIEPTGLSWKMWMKHFAIQAAAGWSSKKNYPFLLQADFQFLKLNLYRGPGSEFSLYAGAGARLRFETEVNATLRFPIGIDFMSKTLPLNFFLEAVPMYILNPSAGFDLKAALGLRYLFN